MGWTEELKWLNYRDSEILTDSFRVAANMSRFGLWNHLDCARRSNIYGDQRIARLVFPEVMSCYVCQHHVFYNILAPLRINNTC